MKRIYKYISPHASALLRTLPRATAPVALALALLLTPALTSCRKVEIDPALDGKYEIAFDQVTTKAVITDENLTSFKVWGASKENVIGGVYGNILENTVVEKDGDSWDYDDHQYWAENTSYRFFAVAPTTYPVVFNETDMTYSVGYEAPVSFNVQDTDFNDIVVAQNSVETPVTLTAQPDPVQLSFIHPMVKVRLLIAKSEDNEDETMIVKTVRLKGLRYSGNYTYYVGTGVSEWDLDTSTSSMEYSNQSNDPLSTEDEADWIKLDFYALPQYISDASVSLEIEYEYTESGKTETKSYNAYIPQTDIWQSNKIITYKVELSVVQKVRFYIFDVASWGRMPSGTVIIQ